MTPETAFAKILVFPGEDGLGYYVALYRNGERGPRSEGYGRSDHAVAENLHAACKAAHRDFPDIDLEVRVDDPGEAGDDSE